MVEIKHVAAFSIMIFPKNTLKPPLEQSIAGIFLLKSKHAIRIVTQHFKYQTYLFYTRFQSVPRCEHFSPRS